MADGNNDVLKLELEGGTVVTGKTAEELQSKLVEMYNNTRRHSSEQKTLLEQKEAELQALKSPASATPADGDALASEFWANLNAGKVDEALLGVVAKKLGYESSDELVTNLQAMKESTEKLTANQEIMSFLTACPDFPGTPEASELLLSHLKNTGMPHTAACMKAAYRDLVAEKKLTPLEVATGAKGPGMPPPPAGGVSTAQTPVDEVARWNTMSVAELAAEAKRLGLRTG